MVSDREPSYPAQTRKIRRRGTRHVKSGCKTCKIRRVKCDEKRPACERCTSTGRTCDGYGVWSNTTVDSGKYHEFRPRHESELSRRLWIDNNTPYAIEPTCGPGFLRDHIKFLRHISMDIHPDESFCLEFFQLRSLVKLPGFFVSGFWDRILPQLSCTEPAVFHAVVALASTQRSQEFTGCMRTCDDNPFIDYEYETERWDRFALQQYNKAILHLRSHFEDDSHHSVQIALTTCILFICIEFMRGSYSLANVHIDHGINVLETLQSRQKFATSAKNKPNKTTIVRTSVPETVDDHLLEILARMNTQCVLFGYPSRYMYATDTEDLPTHSLSNTFPSIEESRQYLEVLISRTLRLVDKAKTGSLHSLADSIGSHPSFDAREELLEAIHSWKKTYERCEHKLLPTLDVRAFIGLTVLRMYSIMIEIMLRTCPGPNEAWNEMVFDGCTELFKDLMRTSSDLVMMKRFPGEYIASNLSCRLGPLNFSADMGAVPPLYYTALKCRVPFLRRQAIRLLKMAPHREAVWDGAAAAGAAEEVVRMEEGDFYGYNNDYSSPLSSVLSSSSSSSTQQDPLPESRRFHDVRIVMEDGLKPRGKVVCKRLKRKSYSDSFGFDDYVQDLEWETVENWFGCDDRITTFSWTNIQDMYRESGLDYLFQS